LTTPARVPGKRGKLPAKRVALGYLHSYLKAPLPAPAYPVDVRAGIADDAWQMLGNGPDPTCTTEPDGVGDCTFAARQHARQAKAAFYGETETWETSNQLVAEYLAYDDGQDDGAVIADLLLSWYKAGKIKAFAPVDHTDPVAVDSAMEAFRGAYCGVDLTDDADQLFSEGQPWTVANGEQPDASDGHCIVKVYADVAPEPDAGDGYVTWGRFQRAAAAWSKACLTEAWAVITTEDEAAKVDMAALLADIEALGGTGGPVQSAPSPKGNGMLAALKAKLEAVWDKIDGEAEAELQEVADDAKKALRDAEAEIAQAAPLLAEFEAAVKAAIAADAPTLKADIAALVAKLLEDFAPLLGKAPASGM
jgi:hypothetical protein